MLLPAIPSLLKDLNERRVFELIRAEHPLSRAEIARRAGISKPTASLALQSLLDARLVREAPGSSRARLVEPEPDAAFVLTLDIGARFLRGAVANIVGDVLARRDLAIDGLSAAQIVARAAELRDELVALAGIQRLELAVAGAPGVLDPASGRLQLAAAIEGLDGFAIADELERALDLPVLVENDINLAALGEQWRGVGADVDDFAFLSIGTGLGAGIVLRGELHRGHRGAAGELDFAVEGGLESPHDPSTPGLLHLVEELAAAHAAPTTLAPPYEARAVFDAARAGDPLARLAVEREGERIARYVAPIAAVVDVELIVLGGGIGRNGDLLIEPMRRTLAAAVPFPPRIEVSALGNESVLTGALAVALREAVDTVFARSRSRSHVEPNTTLLERTIR